MKIFSVALFLLLPILAVGEECQADGACDADADVSAVELLQKGHEVKKHKIAHKNENKVEAVHNKTKKAVKLHHTATKGNETWYSGETVTDGTYTVIYAGRRRVNSFGKCVRRRTTQASGAWFEIVIVGSGQDCETEAQAHDHPFFQYKSTTFECVTLEACDDKASSDAWSIYMAPDTCDASTAPDNGAVGDCTSALASDSTCQPTCDDGYTVSGTASCSAVGVFTAATCDLTPLSDCPYYDSSGQYSVADSIAAADTTGCKCGFDNVANVDKGGGSYVCNQTFPVCFSFAPDTDSYCCPAEYSTGLDFGEPYSIGYPADYTDWVVNPLFGCNWMFEETMITVLR